METIAADDFVVEFVGEVGTCVLLPAARPPHLCRPCSHLPLHAYTLLVCQVIDAAMFAQRISAMGGNEHMFFQRLRPGE